MKPFIFAATTVAAFALCTASAFAADQTVPGAGNAAAEAIASRSVLVKSAQGFLLSQARSVRDEKLRAETLDAIGNPQTCIRHRAELSSADKDNRIAALVAAGLVSVAEGAKSPSAKVTSWLEVSEARV